MSEFDKALSEAVKAKSKGEITRFDVEKDNQGYRYIVYERDGAWNLWFEESDDERHNIEGCDVYL
jgi:hypothetical protein